MSIKLFTESQQREILGCYEKLPAYVTGGRFVPGVDNAYTTTRWGKRWIFQHAQPYFDEFIDRWLDRHNPQFNGHFHKTRESAQAEADRLNGEGE